MKSEGQEFLKKSLFDKKSDAILMVSVGKDTLPYVLNPLIPLKLMHKFMSGVEIDNNNINSKLQ